MGAAKQVPGMYGGRYFGSAQAAASQFQYEARLRSANAREIERFGPVRCAAMQREASALYAAARVATNLLEVV